MALTPTYPGVYIQEVPSGVRTVVGVATSITAFVGRAARGPVNDPVSLTSYADFERTFGGLWTHSRLGFAVRDFFLNGGGNAIVVRLHRHSGSEPTQATLDANGLVLVAATPGSWGNALRARVDHDVSAGVGERYGLADDALFNLTVADTATGTVEVFRNVSVVEGPRRVSDVLASGSKLVRVETLPAGRPEPHADLGRGETILTAGLRTEDGEDGDEAKAAGVAEAGRASDGSRLETNDFVGPGTATGKTGLYALEKVDLFNLLCIPPYDAEDGVDATLVGEAAQYCETRRAMLLVDPPRAWNDKDAAKNGVAAIGTRSRNAALFFPRLVRANPLREGQLEPFVPSGAVAGVFARTDAQRGVWKAPAGIEATLVGVAALSVPLTDGENGELNPLGINCLRALPGVGPIVWGSRTLQGDDRLASEWKYVPVRRTALFIQESLYRGTQWVVFEPNDEPLWAQIRLNVGAFMHNLFRQGAFQGRTPREAYLVKCDGETTTQNDIDLGIVNILVGFAPLRPAEFVIVRIQQLAGQIEA
jgi:uncharacterized protein